MLSSVLIVFSKSKPQLVEEVIELRTTLGAAGILYRTKLSCSFVTPMVKFSEDTVEFRVEMVGSTFVVFHYFVS